MSFFSCFCVLRVVELSGCSATVSLRAANCIKVAYRFTVQLLATESFATLRSCQVSNPLPITHRSDRS